MDDAVRQLEANAFVVTRALCAHKEDMIREVERLVHEIDLVIVGDGTVNAGLKGVLDAGLPLGILPLGTANDFARTLGYSA